MSDTITPEDPIPVETAEQVELPGRRLHATRENLHMSREEVAQHLHLDVKLIIALEEDDFDKLPSPSYICGYLRSYARLLKLPEKEIVESYSHGQEISAALLPENVAIAPRKYTSKSFPLPIIALIVILILLFAGLWLLDIFSNNQVTGKADSTKELPAVEAEQASSLSVPAPPAATVTEQADTSVAKTTTPATEAEPTDVTEFKRKNRVPDEDVKTPVVKTAPAPSPSPSPVVQAAPDLRLVYQEDSWTELLDAGGKRLVYRLVSKGSELTFSEQAPYTVLLGNAAAVRIFYKGKRFSHKQYQRDNIAYFKLGITN